MKSDSGIPRAYGWYVVIEVVRVVYSDRVRMRFGQPASQSVWAQARRSKALADIAGLVC